MGIPLMICTNCLLGVESFSFLLVGLCVFLLDSGCLAAFDCLESRLNVF